MASRGNEIIIGNGVSRRTLPGMTVHYDEQSVVPMSGNGQQSNQSDNAGAIMAHGYVRDSERTRTQLENLVAAKQDELANKAGKWKNAARQMQSKLDEVVAKVGQLKQDLDMARAENNRLNTELRAATEISAVFQGVCRNPNCTSINCPYKTHIVNRDELRRVQESTASVFGFAPQQPNPGFVPRQTNPEFASSSFTGFAQQQPSSSVFAQQAPAGFGFGSSQSANAPLRPTAQVFVPPPRNQAFSQEEEEAGELEGMGASLAKADDLTRR